MLKTLPDLTKEGGRSASPDRMSRVRTAQGEEKGRTSQAEWTLVGVSGRQWAIDLVEAQRDRVVAGMARGLSRDDDPPMYWVQRFAQDMDDRLGADHGSDSRSAIPRSHSPVMVPPPMMERISAPLPPPPSSRRDTLRVPSSFPGAPPLPRFALGPRMDGLFGSERPAPGSSKPSSLAPVIGYEQASGRFHTNPWVAGAIGGGLAVAAGFLLLWLPSRISSLAMDGVGPTGEPPRAAAARLPLPSSSALQPQPGFREAEARELAILAGRDALSCGLGDGEVEVVLTFFPDGGVSCEVVNGFWMDDAARGCLDRAFFGLRGFAFAGEPRTIALGLPDPAVEPL